MSCTHSSSSWRAENALAPEQKLPKAPPVLPDDEVLYELADLFQMCIRDRPTVYRVFAALMLANLCMLVVGCLGVRFFAKIV